MSRPAPRAVDHGLSLDIRRQPTHTRPRPGNSTNRDCATGSLAMRSGRHPHRRGNERQGAAPTPHDEWSLGQFAKAVVDVGGDVALNEQRIERRLVVIIPVTVGRAPKTPQGAIRRPG